MTGIVEACEELMREGHGDILVFLSAASARSATPPTPWPGWAPA